MSTLFQTGVHPLTRALARPFVAVLVAATTLLAGCERPPPDSVQTGYRGTGMLQVYNPRIVATQAAVNEAPEAIAPGAPEGPKAKDVLKNVQVLGDLSIGQFTSHMTAITAWVSPKEGCAYCHNLQDLADDSKYTKVVARRMIQMTRHINSDYTPHVAATGVTCYTCHRGNNVPLQAWTTPVAQNKGANFLGNRNGQNAPAQGVGLMALPGDPLTSYLLNANVIRVGGTTALPHGNKTSIQATEGTYALMVHMSNSLGVNCTYCHNSRNFSNWTESSPKRVVAWHGIRMANDLNTAYLAPLGKVLPPNRLGPNGDAPLASCATCHQGAYKPLYGKAMAKDWPGLYGPAAAAPAAVTTVAAAQTTPVALTSPGMPAPLAEASRSVLYFASGSPNLEASQAAALQGLVKQLKATPAAMAIISGFHSASGTLKQNQELAKKRAFQVRDSLVAAGIPGDRITLAKPQQTGANVVGEDPTARRVEVTIK